MTMAHKDKIRKKVDELIYNANVAESPVPVEKIARLYGAIIRYEPFEGNISGLIYRENDTTIIGVNSSHAVTRQRFTIAHELGHVVNGHQYVEDEYEKGMSRIYTKHFQQEREADMFAGEILMPKDFLISDLNTHGLNEELLRDKYVVSSTALWLRLTTLGLAEKYSAVKW